MAPDLYQQRSRSSAGIATVLTICSFLVLAYLFLARDGGLSPDVDSVRKASVVLKGNSHVSGTLAITQDSASGPVHITGTVSGLDPGSLRGFHIHSLGDLSGGCISTGSHYNPFGETHGAPTDSERHVGDLGNIKADDDGVAHVDIHDELITMYGKYSVIGRAVVVHTGTDDLGRGEFDDSKTTGHAGGRAACGIIGIAN
ncbi:Superoxide dismutase [Cu-Zn] [Tulasnella sp. 403]|nr:Superoxide dismutase [Cu-Zn] [Tulasnella sp. 403]